MGSLTTLAQLDMGLMLNFVKLIGIIRRQARATQQNISEARLRAVSQVVDNALACPKKFEADRAIDTRHILPYRVLHPMGFELMESESLVTAEGQAALVTLQVDDQRLDNLIVIPRNRNIRKRTLKEKPHNPRELRGGGTTTNVLDPTIERQVAQAFELGGSTAPFQITPNRMGP